MSKKIDVKKLEEKIDGMSSICEKGRKEIKEVLAVALKVEFKESKGPKAGQVWEHMDSIILVVSTIGFGRVTGSFQEPLMGIEITNKDVTAGYASTTSHWNKHRNTDWKFIANSLEEYFANK